MLYVISLFTTLLDGIRSECHRQNGNVWGFGVAEAIFIGVLGYLSDRILSLACCLEIALQNLHPLLSLGDQGFIS